VAKSNYGQMRKQKEAARKARQQKKLDRRQGRANDSAPPGEGPVAAPAVAGTPADGQSQS
jgi:hypothetical protein